MLRTNNALISTNGIINGETARTMSDERVWNMIFLPGISTASSVAINA
jgi:chemotaxis protein histidine kinase CheA